MKPIQHFENRKWLVAECDSSDKGAFYVPYYCDPYQDDPSLMTYIKFIRYCPCEPETMCNMCSLMQN